MTIRERMTHELVMLGMWPEDAKNIVSQVEEQETPMQGRWGEDCHGYPNMLLAALWSTTKKLAGKWIAENKPKAWYRSQFDETAPAPASD